MKSSTLKEAEAKAKEINDSLRATDFHSNYVRLRTDEGFEVTFPSAFVVRYKDWYIIFAEHHDPHVYHEGDVEQIFEYQITKHQYEIPKLKDFIKSNG